MSKEYVKAEELPIYECEMKERERIFKDVLRTYHKRFPRSFFILVDSKGNNPVVAYPNSYVSRDLYILAKKVRQ